MKNWIIILVVFMLANVNVMAQERAATSKYVVKTSTVKFFSSTPIEDIEATNSDLVAVVDKESDKFSFRIPIKSFKFDKSLMRQHFNENYMESDKYPHGSFKGKIEGDYSLTEDGEYDVTAIGTLNIHGVEQKRSIPSTITVEKGVASISSKFQVALVKHKIKVPKIVFYNIAENIDVNIKAALKPYSK